MNSLRGLPAQPSKRRSVSPASAAQELLKRRQSRKSLLAYCQYVNPQYQPASHLKILTEYLERVERGECKRLIVTMPPQHGKTETISINFPAWYLGRNPQCKVALASYSDETALRPSRRARDIFSSPEHKRVFPNSIAISKADGGQHDTRQAAHEWETSSGGSYYAVGIGGGLTSRGLDLGIIDDPIKDAKEAGSATVRESIFHWYKTVFRTRLSPIASLILVMTRWNTDDLVGKLLKAAAEDPKADKWEVLHLPAIRQESNGNGPDVLHDVALWPERYSLEWLKSTKGSIGSRDFESLYQGRPTVAEGNLIRRDWWQYYDLKLPDFHFKAHSWDTSLTDEEKSDYSVMTSWGLSKSSQYLLDLYRKQMETPELKRAIVSFYYRDKPDVVLVEQTTASLGIIQDLQRETSIPIMGINPKKLGSKSDRLKAAAPTIEGGKVWLPKFASWLDAFLEEISGFPGMDHDDQVDSATQAINYLKGVESDLFTVITTD